MNSSDDITQGAGSADRAAILRAGMSFSGLDLQALWAGCVSLGNVGSTDDLAAILAGNQVLDDNLYNVIAQALNDRFVDMDLDHIVPYAHQV